MEADPLVFVGKKDKEILDSIDFNDVCITSSIRTTTKPIPEEVFSLDESQDVAVRFDLAKGNKCRRCWKVLPEVGLQVYQDTCVRCSEVLSAL